MKNVTFVRTDLRYTNFQNVHFNNVNFVNCSVQGALFTGAIGLTTSQKRWLQANGALNLEIDEHY